LRNPIKPFCPFRGHIFILCNLVRGPRGSGGTVTFFFYLRPGPLVGPAMPLRWLQFAFGNPAPFFFFLRLQVVFCPPFPSPDDDTAYPEPHLFFFIPHPPPRLFFSCFLPLCRPRRAVNTPSTSFLFGFCPDLLGPPLLPKDFSASNGLRIPPPQSA